MPIQVYNTYTRTKEVYEPVRPDMTGFYVCGPTVYDYFHIGNARPFIMFDVVRRYLIYRGYAVRFVMNLTDIDDKIIRRANELGIPSRDVAQKYIAAFFEDIQKFRIWPADVYPRATGHIDAMVALIRTLVEKGYAYQSGGDVFFHVEKFPAYAQLSGKKLDELQTGARIAVDRRKKNPLDFVLWKASKPGEPAWPSPWGAGRPGWHLECSVMAMKYLGESFDFHAGGQDLIFPHHENEIAQSEAATGKRFARYWLHNGFVNIRGEKMAKSEGNFITAREAIRRYPAAALRLFFLQKHFRSPIDFADDVLQSAVVSMQRLRASYEKIVEAAGDAAPLPEDRRSELNALQQEFADKLASLHSDFLAAMDDDFNTPLAVGKVFDLVRETNRFIDAGISDRQAQSLVATARLQLEEYDGLFDIIDKERAGAAPEQVEKLIQVIVQLRQEMRREKNYAVADRLREALAAGGLIIEDTPEGVKWRWTQ